MYGLRFSSNGDIRLLVVCFFIEEKDIPLSNAFFRLKNRIYSEPERLDGWPARDGASVILQAGP